MALEYIPFTLSCDNELIIEKGSFSLKLVTFSERTWCGGCGYKMQFCLLLCTTAFQSNKVMNLVG